MIALGMCRLSGWTRRDSRLGCRLARNLQGRFYMAPSWSTCDPLSCFFNPSPSPPSCCPLILRSERATSLIAALPLIAMQRQTMDPAKSFPSAFPTVCVFGFAYGFRFRFGFCQSHSTAKAARLQFTGGGEQRQDGVSCGRAPFLMPKSMQRYFASTL